jgi:hypothetical protein
MIKEELESGKTYWFLSKKHLKLVKISLMHKVHQRRAFKFAEDGKKQPFIVHESQLSKLYKRKWEASTALKLLKGLRAIRQKEAEAAEAAGRIRGYYNGAVELNPPNPRFWGVAMGFPRVNVRYGRW